MSKLSFTTEFEALMKDPEYASISEALSPEEADSQSSAEQNHETEQTTEELF